MKRRILIITAALIVTMLALCGGYHYAWHKWTDTVHKNMQGWLTSLYQSTSIRAEGFFPPATGFPFTPAFYFSGHLELPHGEQIVIPAMWIKGSFLPSSLLAVDMPQGYSLRHMDAAYDVFTADYAHLRALIPTRLPQDMDVQNITAWRDHGGTITLQDFNIRKDSLSLSAQGVLRLDDALQPDLVLDMAARGHLPFLAALRDSGFVEPRMAMLAATVLNALTKPDAENVPTLSIRATIQKNTLYLGPLRITELSPVKWPQNPAR